MSLSSFEDRHDDYEFFMSHSTEAELCRQAALTRLKTWSQGHEGRVRLLDFGCGSGEFLQSLLEAWDFPASRLDLTLLDVDALALGKARVRLADRSAHPLRTVASLEELADQSFDVILSNHALYYVDDLRGTLRGLSSRLAPGGGGDLDAGRERELSLRALAHGLLGPRDESAVLFGGGRRR